MPPAKSGGWGPLIGIVVVVLLLAAGGAYFFYTQQQQQQMQENAAPQQETVGDQQTNSIEADLDATATSSSQGDVDQLQQQL